MAYSPKKELKRFLDEDVGKGDITSKLLQKKRIDAKIITSLEYAYCLKKYVKSTAMKNPDIDAINALE